MRKNGSTVFLAMATAMAISGCSESDSKRDRMLADQSEGTLHLSAAMVDPSGQEIGSVKLREKPGGLVISTQIGSLPSGKSGFHLHAIGSCKGPNFTSAGGHLNPEGREHGRDNPAGQHLGDLPNLEITNDGTVSQVIGLEGETAEILALISDHDGTAVIVHANADDYRTDPTGNAGSRIACGVLSGPAQ